MPEKQGKPKFKPLKKVSKRFEVVNDLIAALNRAEVAAELDNAADGPIIRICGCGENGEDQKFYMGIVFGKDGLYIRNCIYPM